MEVQKVENIVAELVAKSLKMDAGSINRDRTFSDLGLDSLAAIFLLDELEQRLRCEVNPMLFWEFPTIGSFSKALVEKRQI